MDTTEAARWRAGLFNSFNPPNLTCSGNGLAVALAFSASA